MVISSCTSLWRYLSAVLFFLLSTALADLAEKMSITIQDKMDLAALNLFTMYHPLTVETCSLTLPSV